MSSLWCFQCGSEYELGVESCIECGVGLVDTPPLAPEEVGGHDEEQLAYELHDWAFESRRMLDQLLTSGGIAHSWQGASLIVRAEDETKVDELVEEVEQATLPTLDPELEHLIYEMEEWTPEQQTHLSRMLGLAGIAHEFDANGDLVAHAEDEERIDGLLDDLEDAISRGELDSESLVLDDDLQINDLLSNAFHAASKLRGNTHDHEAVLDYLETEEIIAQLAMPYGFERDRWESVRVQLAALRETLEADDPDDEAIATSASVVRETLVQII